MPPDPRRRFAPSVLDSASTLPFPLTSQFLTLAMNCIQEIPLSILQEHKFSITTTAGSCDFNSYRAVLKHLNLIKVLN